MPTLANPAIQLETYNGPPGIVLSIPAVGNGNSLIVAFSGGDNVPTMTGYTLDFETLDGFLYGSSARIYHLSNITDGRTTIETGVAGLVPFGVWEVEGEIIPASAGAVFAGNADVSCNVDFTTTEDNAAGFAIFKNENRGIVSGGGWVATPNDVADWNPVAHNLDLGAQGVKSTGALTFRTTSPNAYGAAVMAYASAGGAPSTVNVLKRYSGVAWEGALKHHASSAWPQSVVKRRVGSEWLG